MYQEIWNEFFKSLDKRFSTKNLSKEGRQIIKDIKIMANSVEERIIGDTLEEDFNEQNK